MAESIDIIAKLEKDYCPPLDNAVLFAILSDYDVNNPDELQQARQVLNNITEGVEAEEASGFDPSGSSGQDGNGAATNGVESDQSQRGWRSHTDDTSLSQGMSALDLEGLDILGERQVDAEENDGRDGPSMENYNAEFESLDEMGKEAILAQTFPTLKPFDIKWTLNKCKGNASLTIEQLLNQVFLEESGHRLQGIDGFSESELPPRPRKDKRKNRRSKFSRGPEDSELELSSPGPLESKWETGRQDVEFISSKTRMPMEQVSSMYHKNGASVPATITAIIEAHLSLNIESDDAVIDIHAEELSKDFPSIPFRYLLALIQITNPSTAAAHQLAYALSRSSQPKQNPIQIEFRHAPPDLSESIPKPKPKSHNAVYSLDDLSPALNHPAAATTDKDYHTLRNEARSQAQAASRRGKSDHLMFGAAAYYSSLSRDYDAKAKTASSAAADLLVAQQSSSTQLDLHGTTVKDAVRIAREGVTAWWARRGDGPYTAYRIVTGKGTHSEGGKGKLGPAVGNVLIREGWKVEARSGFLVVTGVAGGK